MTPGEENAALVRRLRAEVTADVRALEARNAEIERYGVIDDRASAERTGALALALTRAYTALESLLERVARGLEGGVPEGPDWHRQLLHNATLDIEDVRPPVLGDSAFAAADEARRFRHFLHHAYGAELEPQRVGEIARVWMDTLPELRTDLQRLDDFLSQLASRLEQMDGTQ